MGSDPAIRTIKVGDGNWVSRSLFPVAAERCEQGEACVTIFAGDQQRFGERAASAAFRSEMFRPVMTMDGSAALAAWVGDKIMIERNATIIRLGQLAAAMSLRSKNSTRAFGECCAPCDAVPGSSPEVYVYRSIR
jgi:hypothetical protein